MTPSISGSVVIWNEIRTLNLFNNCFIHDNKKLLNGAMIIMLIYLINNVNTLTPANYQLMLHYDDIVMVTSHEHSFKNMNYILNI